MDNAFAMVLSISAGLPDPAWLPAGAETRLGMSLLILTSTLHMLSRCSPAEEERLVGDLEKGLEEGTAGNLVRAGLGGLDGEWSGTLFSIFIGI